MSNTDEVPAGFKIVALAIGVPLIVAGMLILMIPALLYLDFVTFKLYSWFVVPLGAPHLTYWHIVGLSLLLASLKTPRRNDDGFKKTLEHIASQVIAATIMLLIGLIASGHIH